MQVAILCGGALGALCLLVGQLWLMSRLSWTHTEEPAASKIGINFSCDEAEYLLLEDPARGEAGYVSDDRPGRAEWCGETLGAILRRRERSICAFRCDGTKWNHARAISISPFWMSSFRLQARKARRSTFPWG